MSSLNKVFLMGNLTRDPQLRYTPGGTAVCEFGIAINRVRGTGADRKEEVTFVDITAWQKTAELCNQYLSKGRTVFIEGQLRLDTWDDKNGGGKRSKLFVVADNVQFLGGRDEGTTGAQAKTERTTSAPRRPSTPPDEQLDQDFGYNDVPF